MAGSESCRSRFMLEAWLEARYVRLRYLSDACGGVPRGVAVSPRGSETSVTASDCRGRDWCHCWSISPLALGTPNFLRRGIVAYMYSISNSMTWAPSIAAPCNRTWSGLLNSRRRV